MPVTIKKDSVYLSLSCPFVHAGLKFWKVNSRKFFAVQEEDLLAPVRKKACRNVDSRVEAIDLTTSGLGCNCNCKEALEDVLQEVMELQRRMTKLFELTKSSKVPLGLRELMNDAFKCKICRDIVRRPVIVTKCCKAVLGCDDCVRSWYESDPLVKNCPACNTEQRYMETMHLHGLDDLLTAIKNIKEG